ncbi:carbohydrate ABC transporter ATP-binding protein (CUT1 family) [Breznakia blatticola]|uniref:Carbohydrate ABC transporter ATP-binding protein (CUT1 family) n=1 Tax=Breznakia blatticola TaxID=1754012 RepID=A0A4R7Z907_9FIRM|nr:sn-glycerol-3-phosphate ABC transporter ATP-binding protein UgpC [Breznakia blatticola]TDW13216.1 carbohydrate ABC transporter ATP-binding protein (CUT1 family) [Breznakia blatticola]
MANIELKNINKFYDKNVHAVTDFNLEIRDKEFIVFVGPSGCGKSTTLRMIAGLEEISSGELYIDGVLENDRPSKDRDIAMVFQSYALYPHMSVYDNMAFGLKLKKTPKDEIDRRIKDAAQILEITDYLKRKPKQLSGGQRQRVALGRAIVRNAKVFLMDEPLSNLDAKLRVQMRSEIIQLHQKIKATTIYVTHDQTEAMTMATRLVIMKDGFIQQIGTPKEVYDHPKNQFVAGFIGSPAMNFIEGVIEDGCFKFSDCSFKLPEITHKRLTDYHGKKVTMGIRPEDIYTEKIVEQTYPEVNFDFKIEVSELLGHETIIHGCIDCHKLIAKVNARNNVKAGDVIEVTFDADKLHFFDQETGQSVLHETK